MSLINDKIFSDLQNDNCLFESIINNSKGAGIFLINAGGIILKINPGVKTSFGFEEDELIGKNFEILFTPQDRADDLPKRELSLTLQNGYCLDNNYLVDAFGKAVWVQGESILLKDNDGNEFLLKIVFNYDKQKRLEKALIKANGDLNNFVYTASHDLKSPINNLDQLLNLLKDYLEDAKDPKEIIGYMEDSIKKFMGILADLSEIGKVQEDTLKEIDEILFQDIFEEVSDILKDQITKSVAVISHNFIQAPSLNISRKNLRSIFYNIISNSIKYASPERSPCIDITSRNVDSYIEVIFNDNGIGMKEEDLKNIFSLYHRAHDHVQGSGVGITLVKRIVENNGGRIKVESEEGRGLNLP